MSDEERFREEAIALVATERKNREKGLPFWRNALLRETERRLRGEALIREMTDALKLAQVCSRSHCRHPRAAHCNLHPPALVWECSDCDCRGFEEEDAEHDFFYKKIAAAERYLGGQ